MYHKPTTINLRIVSFQGSWAYEDTWHGWGPLQPDANGDKNIFVYDDHEFTVIIYPPIDANGDPIGTLTGTAPSCGWKPSDAEAGAIEYLVTKLVDGYEFKVAVDGEDVDPKFTVKKSKT